MKKMFSYHLLTWLVAPLLAVLVFPSVRNNPDYFKALNAILAINVLLFSIVVHEVAHGWTAYKNGDDTAYKAGRLTLSLFPHVSIFGSIILPAVLHFSGASFMIGWAKPVPFQPVNLKRYPRDIAALALAGPMSNFILVALCFTLIILIKLIVIPFAPAWAGVPIFELAESVDRVPLGAYAGLGYVVIKSLSHGIIINALLGTFNLIPFPPLDGFWVFKSIMPKGILSIITKVQQYGFILLIIAVNTGAFEYLLYPAFMIIASSSALLGYAL